MRPVICGVLLAAAFAAVVSAPAGAAMLAAGDAFPAWQLPDQSGAPRSSRELAGKTYLIRRSIHDSGRRVRRPPRLTFLRVNSD